MLQNGGPQLDIMPGGGSCGLENNRSHLYFVWVVGPVKLFNYIFMDARSSYQGRICYSCSLFISIYHF